MAWQMWQQDIILIMTDNGDVMFPPQVTAIERPAHRTEVRAVAFNSLSDQFVTASGDSLKVWQR